MGLMPYASSQSYVLGMDPRPVLTVVPSYCHRMFFTIFSYPAPLLPSELFYAVLQQTLTRAYPKS